MLKFCRVLIFESRATSQFEPQTEIQSDATRQKALPDWGSLFLHLHRRQQSKRAVDAQALTCGQDRDRHELCKLGLLLPTGRGGKLVSKHGA